MTGKYKRTPWFALAGVAVLLSLCASAPACGVPVFRYALERWPAEYFNVLVFHRGQLSAKQKAVTDWLGARAEDANRPCNLSVTLVDVAAADANDPNSAMPKSIAALWEAQKDKPLPRMVACYPYFMRRLFVAWSGDLTAAAASSLVDSPARRKVFDCVCKGDSAVWVLVESGDKAKDDAAAKLLTEHLDRLGKLIAAPPADDPYDTDETFGPKVRIGFSVVRVSRDDPAEATFIDMLMATESDLAEASKGKPTAFPIFGQGRVLFALVGKGINTDNIEEYVAFLCGPCSCQVKGQNPGVDMLFAADWYAPFRGAPVVMAPLPDVIGEPVAAMAATTQPAGTEATEPMVMAGGLDDATGALGSGALLRNMLIALAAIAAAGVVLAFWVSRRSARGAA